MSVTTRVGGPPNFPRRLGVSAAAGLLLLAGPVLAGCAGGSGEGPVDDQIVLGEAGELGAFNPMLGYGQLGVSPIYEGLLAPAADGDGRVPELVPALAESKPAQIAPRTWRVELKDGVTFSDGTTFDAEDVVATYRAAVDPEVAAEIASGYAPIETIESAGPQSVTVTMNTDADPSPYLLLGVLPAERVERGPAATWKVNTDPVGTGPYRLDSLDPDQAVLLAREDHRDGPPAVRSIVYVHAPDDNTRAQRLAAGEIDGASLPPRLAEGIGDRSGIEVVTVKSADWRGISLPRDNPFTADPKARRALNIGVDRKSIVDDVLSGKGEPASTPIASVYGEAYHDAAQFAYDTDSAARVLDEAGWRLGPDGVRMREGARASFPLLYNAEDTLRRDLAVAFAAQMKKIGVEALTRGTSWDEIDTKMDRAAVVLGGGATPYSLDAQVYDALHTRLPDSSPYSNPGNFTAPGLDDILDAARQSGDEVADIERYRRVQEVYAQQPSQVFLAFLHHTYAARSAGWTHDVPVLEPHSHGVTWGPWWNLASWKPTT